MSAVSVIVAAHNSREYLEECLASVDAQTYEDWELICCDDASTDGTWELLQRRAAIDPRIHLARNEQNVGAGASRNRCAAMAAGEYIAIQDADDVAESSRLQRLVEFLEGNPDIDFVSSAMYLFDDHGTYGETRKPERPRRRDFLSGNPFCHAATMFRRDALMQVGGYRVAPETARGHDYDLFMRLYALGSVGHNLQEPLYGYRLGRIGLGRRRYRYRIHEAIIRYRGFRALGLLPMGLPYIVKPLMVGVIPARLMRSLARG